MRIESENFKFHLPITTMILISLMLSFLLWFVYRLL
ncbi:MAG: hypothetical protein COA57_10640 [Flavobacteriales bacterium]|nr:DUF2905 domain-containing protein [Bacteroidia bacterium]PCJ83720.1 MAG: hypothetical protein COA57_10640 [Flavobacteriales bacterium]